jgi:hypothetical protein
MMRIAKKLNQQYEPGSLNRLNVTERDQRVPYELREEFMEKRPLEFALYNYVLAKYTHQNAASDGNSAALHCRR